MAGRERSARARKSISATSGSKSHECGTQFLKVRLADSKPTSIEFDNVSQSKRVRVCSKTKSPNFKYKCGLCGMSVQNQADGLLHSRTLHPGKDLRLIIEDTPKPLRLNQPIKVAISTEPCLTVNSSNPTLNKLPLTKPALTRKCILCAFETSTRTGMTTHVQEKHDWRDIESTGLRLKGIRKVLFCPICKARFVHQHKFTNHCKLHTHNDIILKSLEKPESLIIERSCVEIEEEPSSSKEALTYRTCQYCHFTCRSRVSLSQHLENYHKITKNKWTGFSDPQTDFKYPQGQRYSTQNSSNPDETFMKRMVCDYCEKEIVFSYKEEFERHLASHESIPLRAKKSKIAETVPSSWLTNSDNM